MKLNADVSPQLDKIEEQSPEMKTKPIEEMYKDYLVSLLTQSPSRSRLSRNTNDQTDSEFLKIEYQTLTELWKHTDARFESGVNIYLTASTVVVSAIVFLSQWISDQNLFLSITAFAASSLAITGIILSRRLISTALSKSEYILARDMIRAYFAQRHPDIAPYLYYHRPTMPEQDLFTPIITPHIPVPRSIILVIHLWCSFLIWMTVAIVIWLTIPALSGSPLFTVSTLVSVSMFVYLTTMAHKITTKFRFRHQVGALSSNQLKNKAG